jgi:PhnB protein
MRARKRRGRSEAAAVAVALAAMGIPSHPIHHPEDSTMKSGVKAIPAGYHTATPALCIRGAAEAIEFYKKAFGATETARFPGPGGHGIMHAEIKIGDSPIMLSDEFPGMGNKSPATLGGTCCSVFLYVEDVDAVFQKAVAAGAKAELTPTNMFWGDRFAKVTDPFGHSWSMATHVEDVSIEEMARRGQEFFKQMASQGKK